MEIIAWAQVGHRVETKRPARAQGPVAVEA
jgi:hypothetical protein